MGAGPQLPISAGHRHKWYEHSRDVGPWFWETLLWKWSHMAEGCNATPRERRSHLREGRANAIPTGILSHVTPPTSHAGSRGRLVMQYWSPQEPCTNSFPNIQACGSPHCSLGPASRRWPRMLCRCMYCNSCLWTLLFPSFHVRLKCKQTAFKNTQKLCVPKCCELYRFS